MGNTLVFKHSGRLGDIVYSLPLIQQMALDSGSPAELYIPSDAPSRLGGDVFHPGGDWMVNPGLFGFIEPLLAVQPYLRKVHYMPAAQVPSEHIDLDQFKQSGINLKAGLIQGWYRKTFGVAFPIESPWLALPSHLCPPTEQRQTFDVLMGRTTRFCNTAINYGFLDDLRRVGFIGLPFEYEDFVQRHGLKRVEHVSVANALELAQKMLNCRVYVGNQSVNFAIADGMKIPRALEAFEPAPVASPVGGLCYEYTQTRTLVIFLASVLGREISAGDDLEGDYLDSIKPQEGYRPPLKERLKKLLGRKKLRRW